MQVELIEKIIHLPIAERIEIIERISRSVREDLCENDDDINHSRRNGDEFSIEERTALVESLAGSLKIESPPMTKEETREMYYEHLSEKYK